MIVADLDELELRALGIPGDTAGLRSGPDAQVLVSVRSLGRSGPNRDFRMTDLTEWASSGLANVTRRPRPPDERRSTCRSCRPASSPRRSLVWPRRRPGWSAVVGPEQRGTPIVADVSVQEVVAAMLHGIFPNFVWNGVVTGHPSTSATSLGMLLPAADGDVYIRTLDPRQWDALVAWVDDDALRALGGDPDSRLANNDALRLLLASGPRSNLATSACGGPTAAHSHRAPTIARRRAGLAAAAGTRRMADVELDGGTGRGAAPSAVGATSLARDRRSHHRAGRAAVAESGVTGGPLEGTRVLDFGWTWAAPYCGMILTDLGADVIKVETSRRLDMLRFSGACADGVHDSERSGWYSATNRGKRSITIDMKHPEGRRLVIDLVAISDAAIENFSPGVLDRLGLGWEDLSAVNPAIVLLSLSAYGATGPEHEYVAYGDHLGYASGFASVIGHPDDGPTPINTFYGDPVAGMYGALAVVAALEERELTRGLPSRVLPG